MDNGNGSKTVYTDAVGKPVGKPTNATELASPINLLNPDRYEFYTFDDNGDLVKRLMSLEEIKGIIATGDSDGLDLDSFTSQGYLPEKRVNEVVNTVQNVLKEEMATHKNNLDANLTLDTPDVSGSWSMILPAVFGNSGEDIKPEKPTQHVTPDTIMLEPNSPLLTSTTTENVAFISSIDSQVSTPATSGTKQPITVTERSTITTPKVTSSTVQSSSQSTKDNLLITLSTQFGSLLTLPVLTSTKRPSDPNTESSSQIPVLLSSLNTERTSAMTTAIKTDTTTIGDSQPFSTWIPYMNDINKDNMDFSTTNSEGLTTFFTVSDEKTKISDKHEEQTKAYPTTDKSDSEDLNTQSTEYIGYQGVTQGLLKDTLPLEQAMTNSEKISASALLDQLLLTTNVYEINTELADFNLNKLDDDQRFETTTQYLGTQEPIEPTTEKFLIQINDQPHLIDSIDQLLSQAVNNVEDLLNTVNNTEKIQHILNNSYNKTMIESQMEAATVASNMMDNSFAISDGQSTLADTTTESDLSRTEFAPVDNAEITTETAKKEISTSSSIDSLNKTQSTMPFKTNAHSTDKVPPLINITIITTENMKNKLNQSTAGANSDKNFYKSENSTESESTEIYIESVFDVSKPTKITNSITEIIETTITPSNSDNTTFKEKVEGSLIDDFENNITTASDKEINKLTSLEDKPTTIIIIKRTERPPQHETTTVSIDMTEQTTELNEFASQDNQENAMNSTKNTLNQELPSMEILSLFSSTEKINQSESIPSINEDNLNQITINIPSGIDLQEKDVSTEKAVPTTEEGSTENKLNDTQKNNFNKTQDANSSQWTLVPTVAPHAEQSQHSVPPPLPAFSEMIESPAPIDLGPNPMQGFGLEESTSSLDPDVYQFAQLCNELAFGFWKTVTTGISTARSVFVSPFGVTSLLAMVFLGARGATSGEMNEILKLDDMVTFNPHLTFKSVSESIDVDPDRGVATSAIVRELFSDRGKGKLLPFYKERVRAFYDGYVEEVGFREVSDIIRRRTNLQLKKLTGGKIVEFLKESLINLRPPLAGVSVNLFQVSDHLLLSDFSI